MNDKGKKWNKTSESQKSFKSSKYAVICVINLRRENDYDARKGKEFYLH